MRCSLATPTGSVCGMRAYLHGRLHTRDFGSDAEVETDVLSGALYLEMRTLASPVQSF